MAANSEVGCVIVGPWAASLSWKARLIAVPVWKDYFNDKDILENYDPCIIVSELKEEDSGEVFINDNINLDSLAKSRFAFSVRGWHPCIYVIK